MRFAALVFPCLLAAADGARLAEIRSVYLLPMSKGLDQFIANRLTGVGVFRVVTDPKRADAVLTDHIGEAFEQRLEELSGVPKPAQKTDSDKTKEEQVSAHPSTLGRGKGTVFLVDAKSRQVIWSAYEPPTDASPHQLDRAAKRIVDRLQKTMSVRPSRAR